MYAGYDLDISVADINQEKIELALKNGANTGYTFNINDNADAIAAKVSSETKYTAVLDFVGNETTSSASCQMLRKGGTVVAIGENFHGFELKTISLYKLKRPLSHLILNLEFSFNH